MRTERYVVLAGETGSAYFQRGAATTLARVLIHEGEFTEAEGLLDTITGREFVPDSLVRLWAWQVRAELALARDDPRGALAILDQLVLAIPNAAPEHPPVWVALVRGEALAALGRVDAAEAGLRAAIRDATQHGYRPLLWRVHLALGRLYAGQGRRDAAAGELAAARAVVEQLAATIPDDALRAGFLRGVDALLTAVRLPTSQVDSGQAGGLTGRELEVLRLLAEGRSDREIAAALAITPRTAMTHVANILNKLGVGSRTAAASQAIRQGLI